MLSTFTMSAGMISFQHYKSKYIQHYKQMPSWDVKNKNIIKEYKLMEYSFLSSWGANELSTVQAIKSIKSTYGILELIEKSYNLDYSDSRLRQIETILKALTDEPTEPVTNKDEPQILDILKTFKI